MQPDSGTSILVEASVSWDIDLGITNWDQNKGNYLFLNTANPVYAETEIQQPPEGFVLYQNYPNPFNPSTNIIFRISDGGFVSLKVYDVLGNEITTLVDEYRPAGEYDVEFRSESSIKHPASGIYFYQLKAGDYLETKKMILIK